jgi:hypothetical protein
MTFCRISVSFGEIIFPIDWVHTRTTAIAKTRDSLLWWPRERIGWRLIEQLGVAGCQSSYRLQKSCE